MFRDMLLVTIVILLGIVIYSQGIVIAKMDLISTNKIITKSEIEELGFTQRPFADKRKKS